MDLDLENYSLDDLLRVFKLKKSFTHEEFKEARKIVLATHPDRSKLDKEYFLFFSKAYALVGQVDSFRHKNQKQDINTHSTHDQLIDVKDVQKDKLVQEWTQQKDFHTTFNKLFDEYYLKEEDGYEEWFRSHEKEDNSFETRKRESRAMVTPIQEMVHEVGTSLGEGSSSFHGRGYADLKQVYTTESVMGVSEEDYVQKYKNLDDIIQQRVGVKPLQEGESIHILKSKEEDEHVRDTRRIFKMVQQDEQNQEQQKKFWSHFLQLRG
jgi:hypothetical protein